MFVCCSLTLPDLVLPEPPPRVGNESASNEVERAAGASHAVVRSGPYAAPPTDVSPLNVGKSLAMRCASTLHIQNTHTRE